MSVTADSLLNCFPGIWKDANEQYFIVSGKVSFNDTANGREWTNVLVIVGNKPYSPLFSGAIGKLTWVFKFGDFGPKNKDRPNSRITADEAAANTQKYFKAEADKILDEIYCKIRQMSDGEWFCTWTEAMKYYADIYNAVLNQLRADNYQIEDTNPTQIKISWEHLKESSKEAKS